LAGLGSPAYLSVGWWNHGGTHNSTFVKVQLQLQMARGAQFMALAQIQMIAVRHSVFCIDFMPFVLFVVKFFRLRHDVTVHTYYL